MVDFCLWSSNGGVLYRGNDEVLKKMLSNNFQTHVLVLVITWSFLIQIKLFKLLGTLDV